ncbi:MAG: prolyl oligopeptidase family serine peptidase [Cyclobacteriaceae bacterium]
MRNYILLLLSVGVAACNSEQSKQTFNYPETRKADQVDEYFGTKVEDPYRWLEDDMSEETGEWVKSQNEVTNAYLDQIDFKDAVKDRLAELWNYERFGIPFKEGDYWYYFKNDGLQNQSVLYRTSDLSEDGEVFIDPNEFSEDGTVSLAGITFSKNGKLAAYSVSISGSDWREIYVLNTVTNTKLDDKIEWAKFTTMAWQGDGFYYQRYPTPPDGDVLKAKNLFAKIYYHQVDTDQSDDLLIFENPDNGENGFGVWVSGDERFLVVRSSVSTSGNELFIKDLSDLESDFKPIITGFEFEHSVIDTQRDKIYIETTLDAPNKRLVVTDISNPTPENWTDLIPESESVLNTSKGGGKLFANYLVDAKNEVSQFSYDGDLEKRIELPGIGSASGFSGGKEQKSLHYSFTSFTHPTSIFSYDATSGTSSLWKTPNVDFNKDDYETKQVFYTSKDGTKVPMFITYKKGLELNGKNPTWLYSYGGFNISLRPSFSVANLVWMENGGVYAMPNIRGGGEYGEEWHVAGTKLHKKNVFEDFIAAGEYLINEGYTSSEYLVIRGGSNGGLLIGATINMRPDLAAVAYPAVGVMDMLRYQYFTIGRAWAYDYGTSEQSKEMFDYLYSYSPIHNIKPGVDYPATMVMTADHDDRVVPAHSFKYAATLQERYSGDNPVLIRIETSAGHGAGTPTTKQIEQVADMHAFAWYNMGYIPDVAKRKM